MSVSGQAINVQITVIDATTGAPVTGGAANLTLRRVLDGAEGTITATPTEIDATNLPGRYNIALTGAENTGGEGSVGGKSSTANALVIPACWSNLDATIASRATAATAAAAILTTPANKLATDAFGNVAASGVAGDVTGRVIGASDGIIIGVGAWVLDGEGDAVAPAETAVSDADLTPTRIAALDNLDEPLSELPEQLEAELALVHGTGSWQQAAAAILTGTYDPAGEQFALAVVRGDTLPIEVTIVGDDTDSDGKADPIDLTGPAAIVLSAQTQALLDDRTATPLWSWAGAIVGNPDDGTVSFARAAADTDQDAVECDVVYPAAIRITYTGGAIQTIRGTVVVRRDVLG